MQNPTAAPVDPFQRIPDLLAQTGKVTAITTDAQEKTVVEYIAQLDAAWKVIEEMRTAAVAPLNKQVKQINAEHKSAQQPAADEMTRLRAIWSAHQAQKRAAAQALADRTRKAQEDAAVEAAKKLQDKGDNVGAQHILGEAAAAPVVQAVVSTVTRTAVGTMYERDNWVVEVLDPTKVPGKYWSIDPDKLATPVKAGLRDGKEKPGIPGCRIINKPIAAKR